MTIASTTRRATYIGAGSTGPFAYGFRILAGADLLVVRRETSGVDTELVLDTDYTVAGVGDASGTVTLTDALAVGETLAIVRSPALLQPVSLQNQAAFFPKTHEDEFDRLVMQVQAMDDMVRRAVRLPDSYDFNGVVTRVPPETGKALVWQSDTELGNATLDSNATALPGASRTVATVSAYLLNNAVVNVKDYGALGDGVTDDATAVALAAANASGKTLYFPPATYKLGAEITLLANTVVMGYGATLTTTAVRRRSFLTTAAAGVRIFGLKFTLGQSTLATYAEADYVAAVYTNGQYQTGIFLNGASDVLIQDCQFTDLYVFAVHAYQVTGQLDLIGNRFASPAQLHRSITTHVYITGSSAQIRAVRNAFDNTVPSSADYGVPAIYDSQSGGFGSLTVDQCYFSYCGRSTGGGHQLGVVSSYGDVTNIVVRDCVLVNCLEIGVRLTAAWNVEVANNHIRHAAIADATAAGVSVEGVSTYVGGDAEAVGCYNVRIHHNLFRDSSGTTRNGVVLGAYDYGTPLRDIWVVENVFDGMKTAIAGFGPFQGVWLERNKFRGNNGNTISWLIGAAAAKPATTIAAENTGRYFGLFVRENVLDASGNSANASAIVIDLTIAGGTTAVIGRIDVQDNLLRAVAGAGTGIVYRGPASGFKAGELRARKNRIEGYAVGFDIAYGADVTLESNLIKTVPTAFANTDTTTNTVIRKRDNRWNINVANSGQGVLVNGTVEITNGEILSGDSVILSRLAKNASTALGILELSTITAGVKFVVEARKADLSGLETGDQSTFYWEIVH